jgi:heme/copper-type cytochrome/quinol oxidase subunit 1
MLIFTSGFALAGAHGMGRKIYGAEQATRGAAQSAGLALMGIGGLVAVVGGVLFLAIVLTAWWRGHSRRSRDEVRWSVASDPEAHGQPMAVAAPGPVDSVPVLHGVGLDRNRTASPRESALGGCPS